ncbi:MAG: cupin-like domain-containing protein [Deltaproteobacteria bacterium]|nr:cupin-like domain-containing protein [Deltaproteobacteria bacterium]
MNRIAVRPGLAYLPYVFQHLVPRVPVIVPGASAEIPAVKTWTFESLRARVGDRVVRVDVSGQVEQWAVREFIDSLRGSAESGREVLEGGTGGDRRNPPYLRNSSLVEFFPELIPEVPLPIYCYPNWLESEALAKYIPPVWTYWAELFLSCAGTRFPRVHVDSSMTHAWVIGVMGRKKFWAWPPRRGQPNYSIHSEEQQAERGLDCIGRDLEGFFEHSRPFTGELGPGDFLFLPTGWWHTAESLTEAISLSGNFVNETNWAEFVDCWFSGMRYKPGMQSISQLMRELGRP